MQNLYKKIYEIIKLIPKGKVTTYGEIAKALGNKKLSRIVGYALHCNPDPQNIPCYKVVNRFGEVSKSFAFGGELAQKQLLINDGVTFKENGKVDMLMCMWEINVCL